MLIETTPRSGTPSHCWQATSSSSKDRPTMTSGMTSGALAMDSNRARPRKRR